MHTVVSGGVLLIIPFHSTTLERFVECLDSGNEIEIDTSDFSTESIMEVINISHHKHLSEEAFRLVDFLHLHYILYNYDIPLNSHSPSVIELYEIKKITDPAQELYELMRYFRDNMKYVEVGCDKFDIDDIICNGHIHVLEWITLNQKYITFSQSAFDGACKNGHQNIFEWFVVNNITITLTASTIEGICINGHLNMLNCFLEKNINFNNTVVNIDKICLNGHVPTLMWLLLYANITYTEKAFDWACENGHVHVLQWFLTCSLELKHSPKAIIGACKNGHIQILDWFFTNNIPIEYTELVFGLACLNGHVQILDWFFDHKMDFKGTAYFVSFMLNEKYDCITEWFSNHMDIVNDILKKNSIQPF